MKIYKRHLPLLVSEMVLAKTNKNEIAKFLEGQGSSKDQVLEFANSQEYIGPKSELVGGVLARKRISKEIEIINSL